MMDHDQSDEAPPPYSAVDPLQLQSGDGEAHESRVPPPPALETSFSSLSIEPREPARASAIHEETAPTSINSESSFSSPAILPAQFASAAGYFAEQSQPQTSPLTREDKRETLVHHMIIYSRSHGKDFPRRPRCWNSAGNSISQNDWDTFLNFLFPAHLNPVASSNRLNRRLRAEIERDRKDRAQETDDQRTARIHKVITEWNDHFFNDRGVYVTWMYVADSEEGPESPLCPNCYPQASTLPSGQNRPVLARSRSANAPIPTTTTSTEARPSNRHIIERKPVPQQNSWTMDYARNSTSAVADISPITVSGEIQGQRRNQSQRMMMMPPDVYRKIDTWKGQPMSWTSQMSSIAQQYAAKISNQAQEYSRAMEESALARSRQVEMHSRRVENSALAHARQIEAMALAKSRQIEMAGDRIATWASSVGRRGGGGGVNLSLPEPLPTDHSYDRSTYEFTRGNMVVDMQQPQQQQPRYRRGSTASNVSVSSISSIDTVSSVSDLDPDDLASVRAQLSGLDGYHDHELYNAAVALRSQLRAMKESRQNSRGGVSSRHSRSWGRWESPEEAVAKEQRRIRLKTESKLLRDKFNEVERRVKREVRDLQKAKRDKQRRQRQERLQPSTSLLSTGSASQLQSSGYRNAPERSVSDANMDRYKETLTLRTPQSLNRTISEPLSRGNSGLDSPQSSSTTVSTPTPTPTTTTPAIAPNPHEAAKAWTEAQRLRVKEIQKANKERLKANQKLYKKQEKEQRKAIKKLSKQKSTTSFAGLRSSSSTNLETGTIGESYVSHGIILQADRERTVAGQQYGNETPVAVPGNRPQGGQEHFETGVAELDGTPIQR